ncbi:MAG: ABC transporter ATP-binding protein [Gammaproteobacteria bacterium]
MIRFNEIALQRGDRELFHDVNLTLHARQKLGLIGANGAGKSSIFALLLGELEPTNGVIELPANCRIAHVAQETPALDIAAVDYVLQGNSEVYALLQAVAHAEQQQNFEQAANLHVQLAEIDGYRAPSEAAQLLQGLGFSQEQHALSVRTFSGGWRMRLNLAQALMKPSDLLLLDEPTNHLDLPAIFWLEQWLKQYPGTAIVISHDRDFLDSIVTHIAHIEFHNVKLYVGNYTAFERLRAEQLAVQQATYEKQQRQIQHLQKFVDRFRYKASKARQAQSRLKMLDRIEQVAAVQANSPFHFEFETPSRMTNPLVVVEDLSVGYDHKPLLSDINLQIQTEDRIALLGSNGAGKSTFIKGLLQQLPVLKGKIICDSKLVIGYFAQHQLDHMDEQQTPLQLMQHQAPQASTQACRNYLGRYAFSGDQVLNPIANLSGGERARLALAALIWHKPALLLLDEPTNHLDMEMRMALMLALQSYQGAMILVSHDRNLIRSTTDTLYLIHDGKLTYFDGDLDDYQQWLQQTKPSAETVSSLASPSDNYVDSTTTDSAKAVKSKKINPLRLQQLEDKMTQLELELADIAEQLSDPGLYETEQNTQRESLYQRQKELQQVLNALEEQWLDLQS